MFKTHTFKGSEDSFWFTSDTHFNHKSFVFKPRGYETKEDHDNGIVNKWNEVVKNTDTVFFLGDFILSVNKPEDSLVFLRKLNFKTMIVLWGNHNASLKQLYNEEIKKQYNLDNIEIYPLTVNVGDKQVIFVGSHFEFFVNGQQIIANHFSYRSWHDNGKGSWAICGHSHGNDIGINEEEEKRKILDVGVDNFGRPINFRELKNIMNKKNVEVSDHHGKDGEEYIDRNVFKSEAE